MRAKKAFTLLELMICLAIIALVGSLVAVKGKDLLSHHQFRISSQLFLRDIGRLQVRALATGCDFTCTLEKSTKGYLVEWQSDSPLFKEEKYHLEAVKEISMEGKKVSKIALTIYSSGRIDPASYLTLKSFKDELLYLDLSYPTSLHTKRASSAAPKSAPPYPETKKERNTYS